MKELWTEVYRPKTLDEYVFVDDQQEKVVRKWVKNGSIPHLLLSGSPGTGKTTLAKVLMNELGAQPGDVLEKNASMDNGIDTIREDIAGFASTMPLGDFKYIILDEADFLTKQAQMPLRNLIETYSEFCRFILTCNYPDRIDDALHSRLENFHISQVDEEQFTMRVITVLLNENIDPDPDIIGEYVAATYPDLRSCIKLIQSNCNEGVLHRPSSASHNEQDYVVTAVAHFKNKNYKAARKLLTENAKASDYPALYRMLYNNLEWWADDDNTQSKAILEIRDGIIWHNSCADPEINFSAVLIKLENLCD